MIPVKFVQVFLVTKRPEVVVFWKKSLLKFCSLVVLPDLGLFISRQKQNEQKENAVAVIDSLLIASADEIDFFISKKYISLKKVFIIQSPKIKQEFNSVFETFKFEQIPFPCNLSFFKNFILNLASQRRSEQFEHEAEVLPPKLKRFAGTSNSADSLRKNFYAFGKTDVPLIIEGESGTGKTLAAELIHSISRRSCKSYRRINMPCIQPEIAESELFGSVSGAFTGATDKKGILQEVDGGTVLFDEVSEIPMPVQAKLLKFLDSGCFCRVGSTKESHSDVRIISATNVNLEKLVQKGCFRKDLYERLKGKIISIPPLNSRKEDIDALVENFLVENNFSSISFSKEALETLKERDWTGNVRELQNCLTLTCAVSKNKVIGPDDLVFAS